VVGSKSRSLAVEPNELFRFSIPFVHCEPVYRKVLSAIGLLYKAIGKVEVKVRVAVRGSLPFRFVLSRMLVDGIFFNNDFQHMFDHPPSFCQYIIYSGLYGSLCFPFRREAIAITFRSSHIVDKHRSYPYP
jgi:hypothetical protein